MKNKHDNSTKALIQKIEHLEHDNALLREEVAALREQVRLLWMLRFAQKTERAIKPSRYEDQYWLFDEAELLAPKNVEPQETPEVVTVATHQRKKSGRRPLPADLPRVDIILDIPEAEKVCACGTPLKKIGEEVSEKLDVVPAKIQVIRTIRPKYACPACEGSEDERPTVRIASMPPQLIPHGIVTPSLLTFILTNKFCDALPFYRQCRMFHRLGVDIPRSTMSSWSILAARACAPLLERLYEQLRAGDIVNMDETPVQVLRETERNNTTKSFMWVARGGSPGRVVVLFRYAPTRAGAVAKEMLGTFRGYLQTDGYAGYEALGHQEGIIHVGCLVHVRRKFHDACKVGDKPLRGTASTILNLIAKLYHLEKRCREQNLPSDAILALRKEKILPLLDAVETHMRAAQGKTPPSSLLGRALNYGLGQWAYIRNYLEHPALTPDNNLAENAIRPFVVGRKNWLFSGSPRGAEASALLYSLIESAQANGLEPQQYLLNVFEKIPLAKTNSDYDALMPWPLSASCAP